MSKRVFTSDFKARVVEEFVSGRSSAAQLSRKYEIARQLVYLWKKEFSEGSLSGTNTALKLRVLELEKVVVELSLENQFLKKAKDYTQERKDEDSSIVSGPHFDRSEEDAK